VTRAKKATKAKRKPSAKKVTTTTKVVNNNTGFLIGNGLSRQGFELESLRSKGPIYGCNALYRDFHPDVLCALDHGVLLELMNAEYPGVVGKLNKTHTAAILGGKLLDLEVPKGKGVAWYSGIFAAWLLANNHPELKRVFMLGYDLYDAKQNNIYTGTLNYERMGMNDKIQFDNFRALVFDKFPETTFFRVIENEVESPLPDEWILLNNVRNISYIDFKEYLT